LPSTLESLYLKEIEWDDDEAVDGGLPNLRVFSVKDNLVDVVNLLGLFAPDNIEHLSISTIVTNVDQSSFRYDMTRFTKLRNLVLDVAAPADNFLRTVTPSLVMLSLSGFDAVPESASRLTGLRSLSLVHSRKDGPDIVDGWDALCNIEYLTVQQFARLMPRLKGLSMTRWNANHELITDVNWTKFGSLMYLYVHTHWDPAMTSLPPKLKRLSVDRLPTPGALAGAPDLECVFVCPFHDDRLDKVPEGVRVVASNHHNNFCSSGAAIRETMMPGDDPAPFHNMAIAV
jgi:hypothetical protein